MKMKCVVCGCSEFDPCIDTVTGTICAWARRGAAPLCTFCAEIAADAGAAFKRGFEEPDQDEPMVQLYSAGQATEFLRERG
jgi:hypothetical protein